MDLNIKLNRAACCNAVGNLLHTIEGPKLDDESRHYVYDKQESSQDSEALPKKVDSNLAPIISDTSAVNVLNREHHGLCTQLSIDHVDIFELLRLEILAAEERELEVSSLLNGGEEELEDSPVMEGLGKSTLARDPGVTGLDEDDCQGDAENCSFHNKATDVGGTNGFLQKGEDGQGKLPHGPCAGLLEDTFPKENEGMGAENHETASSDNKEAGHEDWLELAEMQETVLVQDHQVAEKVDDIEYSTMPKEGDSAHDHQVTDEVENRESSSTPREGGLAQDHHCAEEVEHAQCTTTSKEGSFVETHQSDDKVGHEENISPLNLEVNGIAFSREDEGFGEGKETMLDSSRGDHGDHHLPNDTSDKQSENSDDDEYTSIPFSGPIAFSGMLSYSGMLPQIPYSGNISLHSDSSTSTRSFAFPILASDWNSSPAKIGQPDRRYFRQRRKWRPCFCCRRPATLFD